MAFKIDVARRAQVDIAEAVDFIAEESPIQAVRWSQGLFALLETLRELPARNPLIPEAENLSRDLRAIHYHSHRVEYEVNDRKNTVYIVRVYHSARKPLPAKDVR